MRAKLLCLAVLASLALTLPSTGIALAARAGPEPAAPAALDASQRRIALGISVHDGRRIGDLDHFRDSIGGRAPATWSIWSQWGDPAKRAFPVLAASRARDRGATPMIWWEPIDPRHHANPAYARLSNITAGRHDAYIRRYAQDARDFRSPLVLRFAHEPNGRHFPWGAGKLGNTAATFVAAWRHVHRLFREVGATNVRFLWSISKQTCRGGCNPYRPFYPGDAFVDFMGFSNFNWGAGRGGWIPMAKGFRRVTHHLGAISRKPIIAVENASSASGGDKAAWISQGYRAVYEQLPRIVGIVYLDVDLRSMGHPDWRLRSPVAALRAYASLAGQPRFQGRLPGT